jgi:hypothetical protein
MLSNLMPAINLTPIRAARTFRWVGTSSPAKQPISRTTIYPFRGTLGR